MRPLAAPPPTASGAHWQHSRSRVPRSAQHCSGAATGVAAAARAPDVGRVDAELRRWISEHGGFVHPVLELVDDAPCGARGVVASAPITVDDIERCGPLVRVPQQLLLGPAAAVSILQRHALVAAAERPDADSSTAAVSRVSPAAVAAVHEAAAKLSNSALLAAALAAEAAAGARTITTPCTSGGGVSGGVSGVSGSSGSSGSGSGSGSREHDGASSRTTAVSPSISWAPFIASLPAQPPCPWWWPHAPDIRGGDACRKGGIPDATMQQLRSYAAERGDAAVAGWVDAALAERARMQAAAREACSVLAGAAGQGLNMDPDWLLWGLAQVASRSLAEGSGGAGGLVPYVDLLNHSAGSRGPFLQLGEASNELEVTVLPIQGDEVVALEAGDELSIAYVGGYEPLEAWLKFGYVCPSWW